MRGLGDFQRSQMRDTDPRVHQLFGHLRQAVDILEQLVLRPWPSPAPASKQPMQSDTKKPEPPPVPQPLKLAYSVKEACALTGLSRSTLYQAIGDDDLRAVKRGGRTLILAKDLTNWLDALPVSA